MLYSRPPPLQHLRVIGCLCYAHNQKHSGDKFASRSLKCIFIGYPYGKKGWRLYNLETASVFVSRDVVFLETTFPYREGPAMQHADSQPVFDASPGLADIADETEHIGSNISPSSPV